MTSLLFLAIALGVSVIGTIVLWYFSRERRSYDSSIRDFRDNMGALAPRDPDGTLARRDPDGTLARRDPEEKRGHRGP